ncbi:DUF4221 family protein [Phocaeicola sp.]
MKRIAVLWLLCAVLYACGQKENKGNKYELKPVDNYLEFSIDDETVIPLFNLYLCEDNGREYVTFSNRDSRTILIYDLLSGKLIKKIPFDGEGPRGIGTRLYGYYMKDFNHIYVPDFSKKVIYETDTAGIFRKAIEFDTTEDGLFVQPAYYMNLNNTQLTFIGDTLYIPQRLNNSLGDQWVEESPIGIMVDTASRKVCRLPMGFPQLITSNEVRNRIEGALSYSEVFDGEHFIYSFSMDEYLYKVSSDYKRVDKYLAKSSFIPKLEFRKLPDDFSKTIKKTCETAVYGNILYDQYRQVYYRFVYPETELEENEDYLKILHTGRKEFAIMILDKDFNILGETKFPPFTYLSKICFVGKDGLYISTSHFKRSDYDDDYLRFQKMELVKNGSETAILGAN